MTPLLRIRLYKTNHTCIGYRQRDSWDMYCTLLCSSDIFLYTQHMILTYSAYSVLGVWCMCCVLTYYDIYCLYRTWFWYILHVLYRALINCVYSTGFWRILIDYLGVYIHYIHTWIYHILNTAQDSDILYTYGVQDSD